MTSPATVSQAARSNPSEHDLPLGQNRDFKVLLGSQGISALGDAVSFTALPLLVLALTGSGFAMGVVGALQTLPDLFLGMLVGALADRSDRKRMMFMADFGRAFLTALIPLSVFLGGPTMVVILIVAAPMSILRSFFLAGYTASVPALVGPFAGRPGELVLRGPVFGRIHRRAGHRGRPRRRRSVRGRPSPSTPSRSRCRAWACSSSGATCGRPIDRPR